MEKYKHKFVIYKDEKEQWRWRLRSKNGRIIADSGESYVRKHDLLTQLNKIINITPDTVRIDVNNE
jgi:uncharacterized protein YegP (UPF0339 family)